MKTPIYILLPFLLISVLAIQAQGSDPHSDNKSAITGMPSEKEISENEAWHMEEQYWKFVQNNDTISYKKLWHEDFMGYPSFGDDVSGKNGISVWIPKLHEDKNLKFNYELRKKGVNAIDDVVIVFYDADEIWTDSKNKVVRKETFKFTQYMEKIQRNVVDFRRNGR